MDKKLEEKLNQKIDQVAENPAEIFKIIKSLNKLNSDSESFGLGIVIGRLYNSFYYQCRRIFKRDPTLSEFDDFLVLLKSRESDILASLKSSKSRF